MEYYLEITDPDLCVIELDIFWAHVAQHQHRAYYDHSGNLVESIFDPLALVAGQSTRFALYHAKDGDRTTQPPGVGNGYDMIPFGDPRSDIDYATFFKEQGAKGYHNPNYEQDNAPGGGSDPGRSLRFSVISGTNMNELRG
jgi:sugar phosphate isomerase/epimerase